MRDPYVSFLVALFLLIGGFGDVISLDELVGRGNERHSVCQIRRRRKSLQNEIGLAQPLDRGPGLEARRW